jgi:hypothetical protein
MEQVNTVKRTFVTAMASGALTVVAALSVMSSASAEDAKPQYPKMAPIEQYLIPNRADEIALARSAAPDAISRDATVLVLGTHGYETAVKGTNGFVCMVERGWTSALDWPEIWNPKIKGPDCLNPPAARSLLPVVDLTTAMVLARSSEPEIMAAIQAGYQKKQLPALEPGAMSYMMSKSAYLTDSDHHNLAHVMFFNTLPDGQIWGADLPGSPIASSSFWFPNNDDNPQAHGLPAVLVFVVGVKRWSDGTLQLPQS